jgi:hypothetical protein
MPENFKYILAIIGVILIGASVILYFYYDQIAASFSYKPIKEVHVHSDFLFYIHDKQIDLSGDKYQSSRTQILSPNIHLHDNIGTEIHRHADGITMSEFLHSIGFTLTDTCITTDAQEQYCSNDTDKLILFVNGAPVAHPSTYINQEQDHILLYYGDPNSPNIAVYESKIPSDACLYSGTCPERGPAPTESCGLTCDIR